MERSGTETVWRRLRADGLRRTPQREAILDALSDAGEALPLSVLLARGRRRAPGLGERTAERTVALLVDRGAVDAITRTGERSSTGSAGAAITTTTWSARPAARWPSSTSATSRDGRPTRRSARASWSRATR